MKVRPTYANVASTLALAVALAELRETHEHLMPQRIVYVSCSPSTLARDAGILVHQAGYVMKKAGVVNMFPHTSHVESIGVFELGEKPVPAADGAAFVPADVPAAADTAA